MHLCKIQITISGFGIICIADLLTFFNSFFIMMTVGDDQPLMNCTVMIIPFI